MSDSIIDLNCYPSTRYQGSKRKIIPWIYENVKDLQFETVLDGCGGSASVSYLFKKMGKSVTYNDSLKFNYYIGKALIENQKVKLLQEDIDNLFNHQLDTPDLVSRLFKDVYYLNRENKWLDRMGFGILNMNHYTGRILDFKKSIAYHALFQACLVKRPFNLFHRKNLYIRTADVKRGFGNKTTWEKNFAKTFKDFVNECNNMVFDSKTPCAALNESIFDLENTRYDLVYLDVPYLNSKGTNETSNYLKCYHFLEGIANYGDWEELIDPDTQNLRIKGSQYNPYFNREDIYQSFETLITKYRRSKIVISYKTGGIPSIDYIIKIMKSNKRNVFTRKLPYNYALKRHKKNGTNSKEVLIIGV